MTDTLVLEEQGVVLHRIYPAEVVVNDPAQGAPSVLTRALVILTEERAYVWTAPDVLAYSQPWDRAQSLVPHESRMRTDGATIVTDTGSLVVHRGRGCGCSSQLKRYQPWPLALAGKR